MPAASSHEPSRRPAYELQPMELVHRRSVPLPVCDTSSAFFQSTTTCSIPPMPAAAQVWNRQHSVAAPPRADTTRPGRGTPLHNSLSSSAAAANQNHRRKSSSSNAIAPSLQIPPSINDSKGSLAEFAAQVTCLFWFETSLLLQCIEEGRGMTMPPLRLVPETQPTTGFRKWVTTILMTTQVTQNVILLALLFIYRLKNTNPTVKGRPGSEFRLVTVALMLGNKFLDDNTYTNKTWAEVSGISVQEIHVMEVEFLSNMRYSLFVSKAQWRDWHAKLARFWDFFEHNAANSLSQFRRPSDSPTPSPYLRTSLPTPPGSTHTSPPYSTGVSSQYATPGHPPAIPHPLSALAHLPPVSSPILRLPDIDSRSGIRKSIQLPDLESRPGMRKRSCDESAAAGAQEPPAAKRFMRGSLAHPGSAMGVAANAPRLPIPSLSLSTTPSTVTSSIATPARPFGEWDATLTTPLPLPSARAMSIALSGQPNVMPPHFQPGTLSFTQYGDSAQRPPPFSTPSLASPGTTAFYTPSSTAPSNMSPSFILTHRTSPYRPVREVSTLLVPPHSGVTQAAQPTLAHHQMHYQPLGKARNEYRTGVVPYVHQDGWPSSQGSSGWNSSQLLHPGQS